MPWSLLTQNKKRVKIYQFIHHQHLQIWKAPKFSTKQKNSENIFFNLNMINLIQFSNLNNFFFLFSPNSCMFKTFFIT